MVKNFIGKLKTKRNTQKGKTKKENGSLLLYNEDIKSFITSV